MDFCFHRKTKGILIVFLVLRTNLLNLLTSLIDGSRNCLESLWNKPFLVIPGMPLKIN